MGFDTIEINLVINKKFLPKFLETLTDGMNSHLATLSYVREAIKQNKVRLKNISRD